ncbi:hypothetical protein F5Y17DRAFT_476949 [Xylariaceae sp. FL0594]|nr:hypothetical protein F5Y17DRAFT_476949 [Xylariaceae sp. FL0594]
MSYRSFSSSYSSSGSSSSSFSYRSSLNSNNTHFTTPDSSPNKGVTFEEFQRDRALREEAAKTNPLYRKERYNNKNKPPYSLAHPPPWNYIPPDEPPAPSTWWTPFGENWYLTEEERDRMRPTREEKERMRQQKEEWDQWQRYCDEVDEYDRRNPLGLPLYPPTVYTPRDCWRDGPPPPLPVVDDSVRICGFKIPDIFVVLALWVIFACTCVFGYLKGCVVSACALATVYIRRMLTYTSKALENWYYARVHERYVRMKWELWALCRLLGKCISYALVAFVVFKIVWRTGCFVLDTRHELLYGYPLTYDPSEFVVDRYYTFGSSELLALTYLGSLLALARWLGK